MHRYPFEAFTRVAVLPSITDLEFPTLAEINAGVDVTCELTKDGLDIVPFTDSIDRGGWSDDLDVKDPTRYGFSAELKAFRARQGYPELLYGLADLRSQHFLVVRRGVLYATPWETGQDIEVYRFRFGKRANPRSATNVNATFSVPIFPNYATDAAKVAA